MWMLTIHQNHEVDLRGEKIEIENTTSFEDENSSNLMDLVKYMSECNTPNKTWYTLKKLGEQPTTIIARGEK